MSMQNTSTIKWANWRKHLRKRDASLHLLQPSYATVGCDQGQSHATYHLLFLLSLRVCLTESPRPRRRTDAEDDELGKYFAQTSSVDRLDSPLPLPRSSRAFQLASRACIKPECYSRLSVGGIGKRGGIDCGRGYSLASFFLRI